MISPRSFMVSSLVFKSLNHFELIFMYRERECSNFINWHAVVQLSRHHLLNTLSFSHCVFLPPVLMINHRCVIYFWALYSVQLIHICVFVQYYAMLIVSIIALYYCLKSERVMPPALLFFFRIALTILGLLWFHIHFRVISSSVKNVMGNLINITLYL